MDGLENISQVNNSRIAKNTVMLYFRMFITMVIGLYTSRIVLATLGVENYGIYGVIGGVVGMLQFLNASMSGATSRFLSIELGRGNHERLEKTFSSALFAHMIIALIVLILLETVGFWFLQSKLVIPEDRINVAKIVFHLSAISAVLGIIQVPYNACIIAHENIEIYAYVEILNAVLKLLIVFLLKFAPFDKLLFYSVLQLIVFLIILVVYRAFCRRKYSECHSHLFFEKEYIKPLISFSLLDLYGNMSYTFITQGRAFILNIFFGVVVNAAAGLASTVQGVLKGFSINIIQAIRPQIIKAYASGDICRMQSLMKYGLSMSIILLMLISVPFITETYFILDLWLEDVPPFVPLFCRLLIIYNIISSISSVLIIGIHASGKVRCFWYTGTVSLIQIPVAYLMFKYCSFPPQLIYLIMITWSVIEIVLLFWAVKKYIVGIGVSSMFGSLLKLAAICFIALLPVYGICRNNVSGLPRLIEVFFSNSIVLLLLTYFFLLPTSKRCTIFSDLIKAK